MSEISVPLAAFVIGFIAGAVAMFMRYGKVRREIDRLQQRLEEALQTKANKK